MKKLLIIILTLITIQSCKKDEPNIANRTGDKLAIETPEPTRVGFFIDTNWFKRKFPGYWIETHNWHGSGDFNKDGFKDIVVMFATNSPANTQHQKDENSRIVIGVFLNRKTYFQLDTNLVYSYLGGFAGVNVADINHDGYMDLYQMTGYWKAINFPRPSYYNNNGLGGMDSYVFINNGNKNLTKYTLLNQNEGGSTSSIITDNNKNGMDEIYLSSCKCYYEFDGNSFNRNELIIDNNFNNQNYQMNVLTPKYGDKNIGVIYTAHDPNTENNFILKVIGNRIVPIIKFKSAYPNSGPAQEIIVQDLNKDNKLEYIIPMEISSNSNNTIPAVPYLMVVDESGNDVSKTFMDEEITKPLTYEQIDWIGETWQTGFIYHTFADLDNDGIHEIFPANGVGYKKDNNTYYYKFINGKYRLSLYTTGWFGNVHRSKEYINYEAFVDEKNKIIIFKVNEYDLYKSKFKTF